MRALAFFVGLLAASQTQAIDVAIDPQTAQIGDDVTVHCNLGNVPKGVLVYTWKKQGDQEVQMGTNNFPNDVFKNTGRYTIEMQDDGDEFILMLNIKGVVPEDAGEIGCSLPSEDGSKTYAKLDVVSAPTSIRLFGLRSNETTAEAVREFTDGEEVELNEGDNYYFRCVAEGSTYPPAFAVAIGDRDLTEKFTQESDYNIGEGQPGLKRMSYTGQSTTHEAVTVGIDENALDFKCTAAVPGWETEPLSISIKPLLKFPPRLSCPKRVVEELYKDSVNIKCVVKADPPVDELSWSWTRQVVALMENDKKKSFKYDMSLNANEEIGHYTHKVEDGPNPDEVTSSLFIDKAFPNTYRLYTIYAKNELGETSMEVPFVLENPGALKGTANNFSISAMFVMGFATIAYILRL